MIRYLSIVHLGESRLARSLSLLLGEYLASAKLFFTEVPVPLVKTPVQCLYEALYCIRKKPNDAYEEPML